MHDAFSQPWADAWRAAIDADPDYATAGATWQDALALACTADADAGFPAGAAVEVMLEHGRCTAARACPPGEVTAPFVLEAAPATWRALIEGRLDPVTGVALGKVKLAAGSLGSLMMHANGARALVACAQRVPTRWPA